MTNSKTNLRRSKAGEMRSGWLLLGNDDTGRWGEMRQTPSELQ